MQSIVVDKIASVALAADLAHEIRISHEIPCEEGVLVAVEVLVPETMTDEERAAVEALAAASAGSPRAHLGV